MQQQILEYIFGATGITFTTFAGVGLKHAIQYLREHQKLNFASTAVKFVEETYSKLDGPDKYAQAVAWLSDRLDKAGIVNVSEDELKGLIQSSVNDLRSQTQQDLSEPVQAESVQEVEKPVTEMTSTELKNIVTQVVQQHVQSTPQQ